MPCFASGTRILTLRGEIAVEDVALGDVVVTVRADGPASRRVVWTGKRRINITRQLEPELVRPIRIMAGAFGADLPARDLRLSPHHAVYVEGVLVEAQALVNEATIYQEPDTRVVTYHHIELDSHDVLLAEGLPVESYLDTGNRGMFEGGVVQALHPQFRSNTDEGFCVPMVRGGARLEAIRASLGARAEGLALVAGYGAVSAFGT